MDLNSNMGNPLMDIRDNVLAAKAKEKEDKERKELQEKVNEKYVEFVNQPIDDLYNNHNFKGTTAIVKVFDYRPKEEESKIILLDGSSSASLNYRTFSIGKVMAVGPDSEYKPGDIVKLRDFDTSTIDNPRYEAWVNNPYNNSTMNKVGQEPPATINNLMAMYHKKIFSVNPLLVDKPEDDYVTFELMDANISNGLKNPLKFIK
jgi:hypothetical protein